MVLLVIVIVVVMVLVAVLRSRGVPGLTRPTDRDEAFARRALRAARSRRRP
jgi:hypothetical protein